MEKPFYSFKMQTGETCEILQLTPWQCWKASLRAAKYNASKKEDDKIDNFPFILQQITLVGGKMPSIEYLGAMSMYDYTQIAEILNAMMIKIN